MKQIIKLISIAVLGIGLLGLTSGCGKKLVRGASGSDQRVTRASLALPNGQHTRMPRRLDNIEQSPGSQENGFMAGQGVIESGQDITSSDIGGGYRPTEESPTSNGVYENTERAMLTTPASTSSSFSDSPYSSSGRTGSNSPGSQYDLSHSQFGQDGQTNDVLSSRDAKRNGVTFSNGLRDIFFQFDSWRLTEEARQNLEANAEWLRAHPHDRIVIEGHCDERGTQAYNYVLGEKRATMVQQYLGFLGIPQHQLIVASLGKDKPECHTFSENCFQKTAAGRRR